MTFEPAQYAAALLQVLAETPSEQEPAVLDGFARVIAEDRQLDRWPELAAAIVVQGEPRFATVADAESQPAIARALVESARVTVEPALIAGAVIQVGDQLVDTSLRGRLEQLHHAMVTAEFSLSPR